MILHFLISNDLLFCQKISKKYPKITGKSSRSIFRYLTRIEKVILYFRAYITLPLLLIKNLRKRGFEMVSINNICPLMLRQFHRELETKGPPV